MNLSKEYQKLEKYDLSQLYKLLDKAEYFEGIGLIPESDFGEEKKGKNRYMAMLSKYKKSICYSEKLKLLIEDKKNENRLEIAAFVADTILSSVTPLAAFTFGLILSKTIYSEICQ